MSESDPDSLTASVARLHRAGAAHSQSNQKMAKAINSLIKWICINVPHSLHSNLPNGCRLYASGEFDNRGNYKEGTQLLLEKGFFHFTARNLTDPESYDLGYMTAFAALIASGWIDRISQMLEESSSELDAASGDITEFLGAK